MFDLVSGGKASSSLIRNLTPGTSAFVEVCLKLCSLDHARMVHEKLDGLGLDTAEILGVSSQENFEFPTTLELKRSFSSTSMSGRTGLKSICFINNKQVPVKALKAIGTPLLPVVHTQLAADSLGRPSARRAMIDAGVPSEILRRVSELTHQHRRQQRERELLEQDLAARYLPVSMTVCGNGDEGLMRHWIQELDVFEKRIMDLASSLRIDTTNGESEIAMLLGEVGMLEWMSTEESKIGFCSKMFVALGDLMEKLEDLDRKVEQATTSLDMIGSLSRPNSVVTALERARRLLVDVGEGKLDDYRSKVLLATERAHELVNKIENSVSDCVDFLSNEHYGLLAAVRNERNLCPISSEALGEYILEWKFLARKHGISPYALPLCHRSLRQELDSNIEAKALLPNAIVAEKEALHVLKEACNELRSTRREIAERLSRGVSARLPSLGMDVKFTARVQASESPQCGTGIGSDEIDFFLVHEDGEFHDRVCDRPREGKIEAVASSGEKARIILAIECEVPGSIRALCDSSTAVDQSSTTDRPTPSLINRPVAVIYDEIDAHVGGLASVSIAQMLSQQSQAYQVVSITHSASVAATADMHILVKRLGNDGHNEISATQVKGKARLKELARMASGDMAAEEAEAFAVALLRDARDSNREKN